MKNFIAKNKKAIMLAVITLVIAFVFSTAGITESNKSLSEVIDDIGTCSVPQGKEIARGIDVSRYQGTIDFDKVKAEGYSFVILRVGTSIGGKDSTFETNYKNAVKSGLDVGCYFYTYKTTAEAIKEEVKTVLSYIDGKNLNYPVFLDFEHTELLSYDRTEENDAMINTFCKYIKRAGYYPGVYTSNSVYRNYIDNATLGNKWDFWVASYINDTPSYTGFSKSFSMWQYTSNGVVDGIDARVDINIAYVDYPKLINEFKQTLNKYSNS